MVARAAGAWSRTVALHARSSRVP